MTKPMLCRIGIHRPLKAFAYEFWDKVANKEIYQAWCPCGRRYLTDGGAWFGYRMLADREKTQ